MSYYKTRQEVADVIGAKGDVWDALDGGYLKSEEMPDEQCWIAALALQEWADRYGILEAAFLGLLPEIEPS